MSDLPFAAEYAKSGRASCKGCKTPIPQGSLRLAAMLQSAFFDGKQANWYHDTCFFGKQRPKSIAEMGNFSALRYEDQEKIKKAIEDCSTGAVMADVKKGKGRKRANGDGSSAALKDFAIEYSKSSRATCKVCEIKITKGEVRICKKVYDTEIGQKFGGQPLWHHVKCFVQNRSELLFFASGDILPGFNSLTKEDKVMVKKELPAVKQEEVPIKKLKGEPKDKEEKKESDKLEKELKDQNKLYFKYRDSLKKYLNKAEMKSLLEYNKQEIPVGEDRILDLLADIMTFGALKPCSTCKKGQLVLNTHGYVCSGDLTEWTKCQSVTQTPDRTRFRIISDLKDNSALKKYKYKEQVRKFRDIPPAAAYIKSEKELKEPKAEVPIPPLKNLEFFIYGYKPKVKEEVKIRILKMGGNVVSKLNDTLAAVVAPSIEIDKMSDMMDNVQQKDIQVIEKSFFDSIDAKGSVSETINLIGDKNIATWGGDLSARIPQDVIDGKSIAKSSKSIYSKSSSGKTKLRLKDGTAVDPESGLENSAHVYKNQEGIRYTTVLGLTDIVTQKNSYYKLQLLKSDSKSKFWVFRAWGRIGTSIGGNKTQDFGTLFEAINSFEDLYEEKTGHCWIDGKANSHPKVAGKMYPVEIDYGDDKAPVQLDDGNSKLPQPVQGLVKIIFDVNIMKKVMLEFELDTDKMPLGNLSRKQLISGYNVLTELQKLMESKDDEDKSIRLKIIDATNRFYTLVPHNFGVENPPLLDKEESIKTKTDMLDNLLEIEIAYTLLQSGSTEVNVSPLDSHYIKLKSDIQPIPMGSPEFEIMRKYVKNTHAATHSSYSLEIVHLFKVVREGEDRRYKPFKKLPNRKLLWHGSRTTNFAGILSQGLRIAPPEAPVTGYMFGKGIYFADMVSKSANYCCTSVNSPEGILLLCEVALGKIHELYAAKNVVKPPSGYHSVKGVGVTEPDPNEDHPLEDGTIVPLGKPIKKKTESSLLYNEYIVYDVAQVNVKYLCQLKFAYKY